REPDGLDRLRERPDLVDLDENRVRHAALDALAQTCRVRGEEVVADELHTIADRLRQPTPRVPVVLRRAVLDGDDRIALDGLGPEARHLRARLLAAFETVDAVVEHLAGRRVERDRDAV